MPCRQLSKRCLGSALGSACGPREPAAAHRLVMLKCHAAVMWRCRATASPSDVRQGYALPVSFRKDVWALPLVRAFGPESAGQSPNRRHSRNLVAGLTAGQSPASHRAAKPVTLSYQAVAASG